MENVTSKNYDQIREELALDNQKLTGNVLNGDELIANNILNEYKKEFISSFDDVPFKMPVLREPKIWNSKLYKFCLDLPKGADLHVHGSTLLPMDRLIEFVKNNNKIFIGLDDYKLTSKSDDRHILLKEALERNIIKYDDLFNRWTILGRNHKDNRWLYFENLFSYTEAIDYDLDVLYEYYVEAFSYYVSINICHVEIRLFLDGEIEFAKNTIKAIKNACYKVKEKHPSFSALVICDSMKDYSFSIDECLKRLNNTYEIINSIKDDYDKEHIGDFVVGFDLVNEEDRSRPLKSFAKYLLDFKEDKPNFNYYLHSGESLDPDSDNLIDAYLLNTKRVGHGFNLYQYPKLMEMYIDKEICLEVCPISNQALGYTTNIRNHPFLEYIKRGVTLVLASDDPIFLEHNALVDDFFAAIVCFNLELSDIKQLCINSITCSSLNPYAKSRLMKLWKNEYEIFVQRLINNK